MGLLEESRISISLIPEQLIAETAHERNVDLAAAETAPAHDGATHVLLEPAARAALEEARNRWWTEIPLWVRIPLTVQHQEQTNWCWAAVSVSVAHYYSPASTWTQCEMANQELGQTSCCVDGSTPQCNQSHVLDAPLRRAGVFDRMVGGSVEYATVGDEMDRARPLPIRIGWSGGGGHFIAIEGYRRFGDRWVALGDPWYGPTDVAVSSLTGGTYQGTGTWTHTYFTRRPPLPQLPPHEPLRVPREIWERVLARGREAIGGGTR